MKRAAAPPPAPQNNGNHQKAKTAKMDNSSSSSNDSISDDDNLFCSTMEIFKEKLDFLHWTDAVAFGAANRECRKVYLEKRGDGPMVDLLFQPLLTVLEGMIGSNKHFYCGKVYAPVSQRTCTCTSDDGLDEFWHPANHVLAELDPRYEDSYDSLTTYEKCVKMAGFLTTIVSNLRRLFHFDDFANPNNMPRVLARDVWWLGGDEHPTTELLSMYPRRSAFAFNVALLTFAKSIMVHRGGDDSYWNDAFLGGQIDGGGEFLVMTSDVTNDMVPFRDQDLINGLKATYPENTADLVTLGPTLVSKVVLSAPAFAMVPPSAEYFGEEQEVKLPTGLEDIRDEDLMEIFGSTDLEEIRSQQYG